MTEESVFGPGTVIDNDFLAVPQECKRLLRMLASRTPCFTNDEAVLNKVQFQGNDLPCIPGPIKSQALTATLHAMFGIVGLEILQLRGYETNSNKV
ncbi:hypothetical protein F66182_17190, partial [Fusarium sp. NRRL 66182]